MKRPRSIKVFDEVNEVCDAELAMLDVGLGGPDGVIGRCNGRFNVV